MQPINEPDIRASFINCSKGEAKRLVVPRDLDDVPWPDLDFLGWTDPSYAERCYAVTNAGEQLTGVVLRHAASSSRKAQMCQICRTTHPSGGVSLMTARKAGAAGRQGNSVGIYMCSDLACSLYARNKRRPSLGVQYREALDLDAKIDRVRTNIAAFVSCLGS